MTTLVTGSTGFIGQHVIYLLQEVGADFRPVVRAIAGSPARLTGMGPETVVADLARESLDSAALDGVSSVIHLAGHAHERASAPSARLHWGLNLAGTRRLAEDAAAAGVRRLVFVSTIKVNGDSTTDEPITEVSPTDPRGDYAESKFEAEHALHEIAARSGLEVVVVRPPLVVGPGVAGNVLRLMRLLDSNRPLPFGAIENRRSLIGVRSLARLLIACAHSSVPPPEVLVAADEPPLATTDLVRTLAEGMGARARLFPVSTRVLRAAGTAIRRRAEVDRLCNSLEVDASLARSMGLLRDADVRAAIREAAGAHRASTRKDSQWGA